MSYKEKIVDVECDRSRVRVCLVCCTCRDCYYCNRIEAKDPIFDEPLPIRFFCHFHEKDVHPDGDPCEEFK